MISGFIISYSTVSIMVKTSQINEHVVYSRAEMYGAGGVEIDIYIYRQHQEKKGTHHHKKRGMAGVHKQEKR